MKRRYKILLTIIIILIILVFILYGFIHNYKKNDNKIKVINNISNYDYTLENRDNKLYQMHFEKLKKILQAEEINNEDYAKEICALFIIDLYSLNNKINKYDIGGTEFIHPDFLENYKLKVGETIYKYLNTINSKPEVKNINIQNIEKISFKIADEEIDAFEITLDWTYTKNVEYDKSGKITLLEKDNKLVIVEFVGEL